LVADAEVAVGEVVDQDRAAHEMGPLTCSSTARRTLRMWRGLIPRISAACTPLNWRAIALVTTSRRVIARASRHTRRSTSSIARHYPVLRTSLSVCAPDSCNVYDPDIPNLPSSSGHGIMRAEPCW
jgi:hypothetical protein